MPRLKFRIQTDGEAYRVQQKGWFFWTTLGVTARGGGTIPHSFVSKKMATEFIREEYGNNAEIVRKWRHI